MASIDYFECLAIYEDALQAAIYLSYLYARNEYTVIKEMTTGKGFADVVYIPVIPFMY